MIGESSFDHQDLTFLELIISEPQFSGDKSLSFNDDNFAVDQELIQILQIFGRLFEVSSLLYSGLLSNSLIL